MAVVDDEDDVAELARLGEDEGGDGVEIDRIGGAHSAVGWSLRVVVMGASLGVMAFRPGGARSRSQLRAANPELTDEQIASIGVFGTRDDDQPVPAG